MSSHGSKMGPGLTFLLFCFVRVFFFICQTQIKPGINLYDLCESMEALNRKLVKAKGLERGIAFPTGVSRNHVAAHYSPNPGDRNEILQRKKKRIFVTFFSFFFFSQRRFED
jgi:hypothetical protein